MNNVVADLESLTGKIIRGDITPIVYELIKDSGHIQEFKEDFMDYMSEERSKDVLKQNIDSNTSEDTNTGFSFEKWLADAGEPISLRGKVRRSR